MTSDFLGGAAATAAAAALWATVGWHAVSGAGALTSVVAVVVRVLGRCGPLTADGHHLGHPDRRAERAAG